MCCCAVLLVCVFVRCRLGAVRVRLLVCMFVRCRLGAVLDGACWAAHLGSRWRLCALPIARCVGLEEATPPPTDRRRTWRTCVSSAISGVRIAFSSTLASPPWGVPREGPGRIPWGTPPGDPLRGSPWGIPWGDSSGGTPQDMEC